MTRYLSLFVLFLLAACSFAPLRPTFDLLGTLPQTSGSFTLDTSSASLDLLPFIGETAGDYQQNLPSGVSLPLSLTLPGPSGQPINLAGAPLPVTLEEATLRYALQLSSDNLTGDLTVQPYLAPAGTDTAAQAAYTLGPAQFVPLGGTDTLQGEVSLNAAQLAGINDRQLRLALGVSGEVGVAAAGEVTLGYAFSALSLDVGAVGAVADTRLPDAQGEALDFTDVDVPGPGRLIGADLNYSLTLSHDADASGGLRAQVYVAPPGTDDLWQDAYLFDTLDVDLAQPQVDVAGRASLNEAQRPLLDVQQLRFGVRLSGDTARVNVDAEESITIRYDLDQLDLTVSYAL